MSDEREKQEKKSRLIAWATLLSAIAAVLTALGFNQFFPDIVKRIFNPTPTLTNKQEQDDAIRTQIKDYFRSGSANLKQPVAPPANYSCPIVSGAAWLQYPQYWYGSYVDRYGYINYISYDQRSIYVVNSYFGISSYIDPAAFGGRGQWWPLKTAPFSICVDQQGLVFIYFSG